MEEQKDIQTPITEPVGLTAEIKIPPSQQKIIDLTQKQFWKSKTFWTNMLLFGAALAYAIAEDITIGAPVTAVTLINLVLRSTTKSGISWRI